MWSSNSDKHCFLVLSETDSSSPPALHVFADLWRSRHGSRWKHPKEPSIKKTKNGSLGVYTHGFHLKSFSVQESNVKAAEIKQNKN